MVSMMMKKMMMVFDCDYVDDDADRDDSNDESIIYRKSNTSINE